VLKCRRKKEKNTFENKNKTKKQKTKNKKQKAADGGRMENIMAKLIVNNENIASLKDSKKTVLLDFYADWCGPCRMVSPIIDEIAKERQDVLVAKINVENNADLADEYKVYSIPTLLVLKDGKVVKRASGARPKAGILDLLDA
jgi:thioredoxin 1